MNSRPGKDNSLLSTGGRCSTSFFKASFAFKARLAFLPFSTSGGFAFPAGGFSVSCVFASAFTASCCFSGPAVSSSALTAACCFSGSGFSSSALSAGSLSLGRRHFCWLDFESLWGHDHRSESPSFATWLRSGNCLWSFIHLGLGIRLSWRCPSLSWVDDLSWELAVPPVPPFSSAVAASPPTSQSLCPSAPARIYANLNIQLAQ